MPTADTPLTSESQPDELWTLRISVPCERCGRPTDLSRSAESGPLVGICVHCGYEWFADVGDRLICNENDLLDCFSAGSLSDLSRRMPVARGTLVEFRIVPTYACPWQRLVVRLEEQRTDLVFPFNGQHVLDVVRDLREHEERHWVRVQIAFE